MDIRKCILLSLLVIALVVPALAGVQFLYGKPEMSAVISGTNEFSPGVETPLAIVVSNSGTNPIMEVDPTKITPQDPPNLAKLVKVGLESGDAPVEIKSDPQMLGDIPGGVSKPVTFVVKFDKNAKASTYDLPLTLTYQYVDWNEQEKGSTILQTDYRTKTETISLPVTVKSDVNLEVEQVETEHLNVGTEGYLKLVLKNVGDEHAGKAVAKLVPDANGPLVPTDGSVYIGAFNPGDVTTCVFKVSTSKDAEPQTYPLKVVVEYEKANGEKGTSDTEVVGVPVGGKIDFTIVSTASTVHPGQKATIEVTYKNSGSAMAYNAQARISAVDPFTSNDDTAYLGDLAPGESAVARYTVSVDKEATLKNYGLDSEVRYRDALDNSQISDTMKLTVDVVKAEGLGAVMSNPIVIAAVLAVLIGAGYYIVRARKSK
ncbi:S-layer protein [Methanofollis formosanus]|uniref:S-layer protein n=1 Tax=Methanofollis formosanus TaxID=299308 RepID=A0A8G1EGY1_9EURY|nr:CARDB domain-containing protein [Methanofollis formosanus]QYZ79621.1 S-layer protein [Methanofollis formosanus]